MEYVVTDNQNLELLISKRGEDVWILFKDLIGPPGRNEILIVYDNINGTFKLIASEGNKANPNQFQSIEELLMNLGLRSNNIIRRMVDLFKRGINEWRELYLRKEQEEEQFPNFTPQREPSAYPTGGVGERFNARQSRPRSREREPSAYPTGGVGERFNARPRRRSKQTPRRSPSPKRRVPSVPPPKSEIMKLAEKYSDLKFNPGRDQNPDVLYDIALGILGVKSSDSKSVIKKSYFKKIRKYHPDKCPNSFETIDDVEACKLLGQVIINAYAYIEEYRDGKYRFGLIKKRRSRKKSKKKKKKKKKKLSKKKKLGIYTIVSTTYNQPYSRRTSRRRHRKKKEND